MSSLAWERPGKVVVEAVVAVVVVVAEQSSQAVGQLAGWEMGLRLFWRWWRLVWRFWLEWETSAGFAAGFAAGQLRGWGRGWAELSLGSSSLWVSLLL